MKTCSTCKAARDLDQFHRSSSTRDGLDPRCRSCRREATARHTVDVELKRAGHRLRFYGITPEQYEAMHLAQAGLCAICHEPETMTYRGKIKSLSVDHDHETGEVRGLLCAACNFALGKFRDDPALLRAAADYLEADCPTLTNLSRHDRPMRERERASGVRRGEAATPHA